jgi:hypothetical protein
MVALAHRRRAGGRLILPNLLSIATLGSLLDVSLPPRTISIMAYAMLAVCARRIPFALTVILFLGILAFDLVWTISVSFGLAPSELVTALDHAQHVHVFQSPLYGALIGVLMATSAVTLWLLYRRETLLRANIVAMFAAALMFAGVDFMTNVSPHYQFGTLLGRNVPIESAAAKSGFNTIAGTNGRNVILVMVEASATWAIPRHAGRWIRRCSSRTSQINTGSPQATSSTTGRRPRGKCASCATRASHTRNSPKPTALRACLHGFGRTAMPPWLCMHSITACSSAMNGIRSSASTRSSSAKNW